MNVEGSIFCGLVAIVMSNNIAKNATQMVGFFAFHFGSKEELEGCVDNGVHELNLGFWIGCSFLALFIATR